MLALQRLRNEMTQEQRKEMEERRLEREQLRAMFNFDLLNQIARDQAEQAAAQATTQNAAIASRRMRNN